MTTVPPIPPHGDHQTPEERRQLASRFIIDARQELETGNRLQAGEKAWGAVAQMFKLAAERRGWQHMSHPHIVNIGRHLRAEYEDDYASQPLADAIYDAYDKGHRNFYENWSSLNEVERVVEGIETFLPVLDAMASSEPRPFTITSNTQRDALRMLTGNYQLQVGDRSEVGFSLRHQPGENGSGCGPQ